MRTTALRSLLPVLAGALLAGSALAQQTHLEVPPTPLPHREVSDPQAPEETEPAPVIPEPLLIVNSRIILGSGGLSSLNPNDIAAITVYGHREIPARWRTATAGGMIGIRLKPGVRVASQPLRHLKRQLHVRGPVCYLLDGRPLEDQTLRIAPAAIEQLAAVPPGCSGTATTIAIRLKPYVPQPSNDPPGTMRIMVRGVAGR